MALSETTFGKYTLLRRIASGGMAEIYLARQEGMAGFAREVAIKRIHEHMNADPEFISMFLDEARLMSRLSHPNIVSVHEFGKEDNAHYLVMEFVDGEPLSSAIKRSHGVTPIHALRVISEVCAGLHYAHSLKDESGKTLGVVHRDVSPQNVLLGYDGSVKLIDFGVAKAETQEHETKVGSFKGKYSYMAPEQARGKSADLRADVHAVGIVLWEMLTGRSLYHRESVFHTMEAVVSMTPPGVHGKVKELPEEIDDILAKALSKSPDNRYQSCAEMQVAIDDLVAEKGLHSSSLTLGRYVSKLFRRVSRPPPAPPDDDEFEEVDVETGELEEPGLPNRPSALSLLGGGRAPKTSPMGKAQLDKVATNPSNLSALDMVVTKPEQPQLDAVSTHPDHRPGLSKTATVPEGTPSGSVVEAELLETGLGGDGTPTFDPDSSVQIPVPEKEEARSSLADEWEDLPETNRMQADHLASLVKASPSPAPLPKPEPMVGPSPPPPEEIPVEPVPQETAEAPRQERRVLPVILFVAVFFAAAAGGLYWMVINQEDPRARRADTGAGENLALLDPSPGQTSKATDAGPPAPRRDAATGASDPDATARTVETGDASYDEEVGPAMTGLPTAYLSVYSTPTGAMLLIDGRPTGERTAVRDMPLDPGEHVVELSHDTHRRWRKRVTVELGQTLRLRAALTPLSGEEQTTKQAPPDAGAPMDYGMLSVESVPPARVYKGRNELGRTPLYGVELPAGNYTLTFVVPSGRRYQKSVSIRSGRTTRRQFELEPQKTPPESKVSPTPEKTSPESNETSKRESESAGDDQGSIAQ